MDDKPSGGESQRKLTRSAARHERRKRLSSARRAAERDSSPLANVENVRINDLENREDRRIDDSLSKSKARRLRRKKRIDSGESLEKNSEDKSEVANSASRVKRTSIDETVGLSSKPKIRTDFSNARKESSETRATTPNEHELFENEKNRKISECTKLSDDSRERTRRDDITNLITDVDDNPRIINEREIIAGPLIIRESERSSVSEERTRESRHHVEDSHLRMEIADVGATADKIVGKMTPREKTREEIKAEREAKKAAKAASKGKVKAAVANAGENATLSKSPRCDVVDGVIVPMMHNIGFASTLNLQPEVTDPLLLFCPQLNIDAKSKSELRAERRAKQEAQRAAKSQTQQQPQPLEKPKVVDSTTEISSATGPTEKTDKSEKLSDDTRTKIIRRTTNAHEVNLFKHLYHDREQTPLNMTVVNSKIHPSIVRLGVRYAEKVIVGSNARCVALLAAVKRLIRDFEKPAHSDFTRSLEACLQESSAYLNRCRPIAVSMQNALRHLKWQMSQLEATTSDDEAKTKLESAIDTYIQEQIQLAGKAISITIQTKISNGDVILTYGYSSLICKILCDAHDAGRQFRVVVVDGRPWLEGREQLRRLVKHGLECSYVLINALSFIMPEVSKVFLGAHAILANGAVMSRVGTAQVALMAKSFNVPVLVACETHKSCERVQTDSIVYNEIADADELARTPMGSTKKTLLINWRGKKSLNLLNITYDVTPADLVTAVVTELAILPCTSVPVILRIKPSEI